MCGIAGWIDYRRSLLNPKAIESINQMKNTLSRRGPDEEGTWLSENALLAHRRLTIIDPEGGKQPMSKEFNGKTYIITYNGELYNTSELRNELQSYGHKFKGHSDTEVLLTAYIHWGYDCITRLNGIFAFGVYDQAEQTLFLGRDHFGVKPLFYTIKDSSIYYGSEIKALLANDEIQPELDLNGLAEVFYILPSRTPGNGVLKGIHSLRPAHYLIWNNNGCTIKKYWSLQSKPHVDSTEKTIETLQALVTDSIQRQLVSDFPLCTFLSGGLDSSIISAIAANWNKSKNMPALNTYSIDYVDNDIYFKNSTFQPDADKPWVKRMTEHFGTNHHYIYNDTLALADSLFEAVDARDTPGMADIDSSLLLFCKEIKKDYKVALSGECADEIFGGYPWFHKKELLEGSTFPWSVNLDNRTRFLSLDLINSINPHQYVEQRFVETSSETPKLQGENKLDALRRQMFYLNITWFMTTLLDRKDRMSMATGLEVRVPFCDYRLVQYAWNIPWEIKMFNGREKGILRKAMEGLLPEDVLYRKKSPYPKTHNPEYEKRVSEILREILNNPNAKIKALVNSNEITNMINSKSDYGKPWFGQLMATPQMYAYLIQVEYWLNKYKIKIL